ncbi:MAG TPA: LysE family translocator [Trebonia sp.]|nr:LysE family translocator [Trebonia sp.]
MTSFAVVAGLMTIIPGLDTALVVRTAVTQGRRHGFAVALGINTGVLIWGAAAAAGVSALLVAPRLAYDAVRTAGAVYLVWLGTAMLWRTWKRRGTARRPPRPPVPRQPPGTEDHGQYHRHRPDRLRAEARAAERLSG